MRSSEEKNSSSGSGSVGANGSQNNGNSSNSGSNSNPKIRIAVFGQHEVGKSALTVRYLTKRYIGEYKSSTDLLYHQTVTIGSSSIDVEIVDISTSEVATSSKRKSFPVEEIQRADGFVIVYSITDRSSFQFAQDALQTITNYHNNQNISNSTSTSTSNSNSLSPSASSSASSSPSASPQPRPTCPILLLANKLDLEHLRVVEKVEGLSTSMQYGSHFYELSVAENSPEVYTSFQSLISQFITQQKEPQSKRKFSVSKMLGSLRIGRTSPSNQNQVVTSQASVVDTDILSNESVATSSPSRGPSPVPAMSASVPDSSNSSSFAAFKGKIVELQSIKKRQNSPPVCSL